MEVKADPFESAKSHFFNTSSWGPFCDLTLTLKQGRRSDSGCWVKIDVGHVCLSAAKDSIRPEIARLSFEKSAMAPLTRRRHKPVLRTVQRTVCAKSGDTSRGAWCDRDAFDYYHERRDENRNVGLGPKHDWSSIARSFGYMALSYEEPPARKSSNDWRRFDNQPRGTFWSG
jgi:hypothetical protein